MAFSVEEFRPLNPVLVVDDRELELSLITLDIDGKIKAKFGKLENIFDEVRKTPFRLFDALWILLVDKSQFNYSKKELTDFILSYGKTSEVTGDIYNAIHESIGKSMPIIKNRVRYEELLKINQGMDAKKPCYGIYYDTLGKRYNYTIEQFYSLTLRQLHILLHVIGDQSYEEIEIQAALQGKKLKPRMKPLEIEEEQDKSMEEEAKNIHAQLMKEYNERQGK